MEISNISGPDHANSRADRRIHVLDFWRSCSVLFVMAGHLLPLGPAILKLNEAVAAAGMAIFFTLSGFLITRFLLHDTNIRKFLVRRVFRIVPLAWLGILISCLISGGTAAQIVGNMFFFANVPPFFLLPAAGHFWSLSVEIQFYALSALLVGSFGTRSLLLFPILSTIVTLLRIHTGNHISIVTWFRIDEILAGATLALVYEGQVLRKLQSILPRLDPFILFAAFLFASHELGGPLNYLRPYLAAMMIGSTLYGSSRFISDLSKSRIVLYLASVSYALYIFHGLFRATWLGSGTTLVKYLKRPLLFAATFAAAHLSTFYYEKWWNKMAHKMS